ncbi:hypothetical protein, partial [Helicobacter sp. 23-1045]
NGAFSLLKCMFGFSASETLHKWHSTFSTLGANANEMVAWITIALLICVACRNAIQIAESAKMLHFIIAGFAFAFVILEMLGASYAPPFIYFNF